MSNNIAIEWQDGRAAERLKMIAPLLDEGLDTSKRSMLRQKISEDSGISVRTIYRYEKAYKENNFDGLRPCDRAKGPTSKLPKNFDVILEQAKELKREVPSRSVSTIIQILEMEGYVAPGVLKRSTLERYLYKAGYGVKQMQMYNDARKSSSKRFCKPHRMMLIQADIKYGPNLPTGQKGKYQKTYLSSAIDDHSRYILSSKFYANEEAVIVAETMREAINKFGAFDACYVDNGRQYVAKQLGISLGKLGITVRKAPIQSGRSKGKIEKFHQVVDSYLAEVKLKNPKTLEELNYYWQIYLEENYQKKSHDGIREYYESLGVPVTCEGISPLQEFNRDTRQLKFLDVDAVAEAFLNHEYRNVDKGACISFKGKRYETKPELIGCKVEIAYDPLNPVSVTVRYPGIEPFEAQPVKIGEFCAKNPALPISMQKADPTTSRLLDGLEKKHTESQNELRSAVSYESFRKGGGNNV